MTTKTRRTSGGFGKGDRVRLRRTASADAITIGSGPGSVVRVSDRTGSLTVKFDAGHTYVVAPYDIERVPSSPGSATGSAAPTMLAALALCLAAAVACSDGDSVVVVSVKVVAGVPPVSQLRATFLNAGQTDVAVYPRYAGSDAMAFPTAFSVTIPGSRGGELDVSLDGLDGTGKPVARSERQERVSIRPGGRSDVTVWLDVCPTGGCPDIVGADGGTGGSGGGGGGSGGADSGAEAGGGSGGGGSGGTAGVDGGMLEGGSGGAAGADAGPEGGGGAVGADAGPESAIVDAGAETAPCDLVTSSGCGAGMRCGVVCSTGVVSCGPAGTKMNGTEYCGAQVECAPGYMCMGAYGCRKMCWVNADCANNDCAFTPCSGKSAVKLCRY